MYAIILVAGYATRLYPLTKNQPKALLTIGHQTILDYIMDEIDTLDEVTHTVVVSNAKFYAHFTRWAAARKTRAPLSVLDDGTTDEDTRRGAIGDMDYAVRELSIDEDILVVAGDNFFTFRLAGVRDFFYREKADTVVVKRFERREDLKGMGVAILDAEGRVVEFEEKPEKPGSDLGVFATYVYRRDTLPLLHEYLDAGNPKDAPGNFPAWLCKRRPVTAYPFEGECYDVGTHESYNALRERYANY